MSTDTLSTKKKYRRRPKGKIPCVAIQPRRSRSRVTMSQFPDTAYREWKVEIHLGSGRVGLVYLTSADLPRVCVYEGEKYTLAGTNLDGTLQFYSRESMF